MKKKSSDTITPKFKSFSKDLELAMKCKTSFDPIQGMDVVQGYSDIVQKMFEIYLNKKAYTLLIDYLKKYNWETGQNDLFRKLSNQLKNENELELLKDLWECLLVKQEKLFIKIAAVARKKKPYISIPITGDWTPSDPKIRANEVKLDLLRSLRDFKNIIVHFKSQKDLNLINSRIDKIENTLF